MIWERWFGVREEEVEAPSPLVQRYAGDAIEECDGAWVLVDRVNGMRTRLSGEEMAGAILGRGLAGYEPRRLAICGTGYSAYPLADGRWLVEFDMGAKAAQIAQIEVEAADLAEVVRNSHENFLPVVARCVARRRGPVTAEA
jgi:hypothetical protein